MVRAIIRVTVIGVAQKWNELGWLFLYDRRFGDGLSRHSLMTRFWVIDSGLYGAVGCLIAFNPTGNGWSL